MKDYIGRCSEHNFLAFFRRIRCLSHKICCVWKKITYILLYAETLIEVNEEEEIIIKKDFFSVYLAILVRTTFCRSLSILIYVHVKSKIASLCTYTEIHRQFLTLNDCSHSRIFSHLESRLCFSESSWSMFGRKPSSFWGVSQVIGLHALEGAVSSPICLHVWMSQWMYMYIQLPISLSLFCLCSVSCFLSISFSLSIFLFLSVSLFSPVLGKRVNRAARTLFNSSPNLFALLQLHTCSFLSPCAPITNLFLRISHWFSIFRMYYRFCFQLCIAANSLYFEWNFISAISNFWKRSYSRPLSTLKDSLFSNHKLCIG